MGCADRESSCLLNPCEIATRTEAVRLNLDRHGVRLFRGQAKLLPGPAVLVRSHDESERTLRADIVLLATGSRPLHPPDIPFDDTDIHDSKRIIGLRTILRSIVVIGGGAVGCEYASVSAALGANVTLLNAAAQLVPFMDAEISDVLARTFARMRMRVVLGSVWQPLSDFAGNSGRAGWWRAPSAGHRVVRGGACGQY